MPSPFNVRPLGPAIGSEVLDLNLADVFLPETLQALRDHLFNGVIWPDFTRLPSVQHPILVFHELAVGDVLIRSDGVDQPVARCSMTYSIPPKG